MKHDNYFIELTDTYGGEANYSWVKRFKVSAATMRGAITKASKEIGLQGRLNKQYDDGETVRYNVLGAALCLFVQLWSEYDSQYFNVKEL
jgi:hypothetical protein